MCNDVTKKEHLEEQQENIRQQKPEKPQQKEKPQIDPAKKNK